jgi:hypothetical protein
MANVALVVLADTETHADMGRVANALSSAKEFKEANHEVTLVFDGAGTRWVGELSNQDHPLSGAFDSVKDTVAGACSYCAASFGAKEDVQASDVPLLDEYEGHPSLERLVSQDYRVITF